MQSDEQQIRQLIADWMAATRAGEIDKVLGMITDDVVFLLPGREPMRREEFERQSRAQAGSAGKPAMQIDGKSEIQEVQVSGNLAFLWSALSIKVTPPDGATIERAGHTLTVFRKEGGKWRLARDANLLAPVAKDA